MSWKQLHKFDRNQSQENRSDKNRCYCSSKRLVITNILRKCATLVRIDLEKENRESSKFAISMLLQRGSPRASQARATTSLDERGTNYALTTASCFFPWLMLLWVSTWHCFGHAWTRALWFGACKPVLQSRVEPECDSRILASLINFLESERQSCLQMFWICFCIHDFVSRLFSSTLTLFTSWRRIRVT